MRPDPWYLLLALAAACAPGGGYEVRSIGELRAVHRDGDARARVDLRELEPGPGTFALGPLAGLRGEVTVIDGRSYVSRLEDGRETVETGAGGAAAFLVFGRVAAWRSLPLPHDVRDVPDLERWLPVAAAAAGLPPDEPFPFKIETDRSTVRYHVLANPDPGDRIDRPHRERMRPFEIVDRPAILLGVHSAHHAGVFTHHGASTHIHVVGESGLRSGHVDAATFGPGAVVSLPVP